MADRTYALCISLDRNNSRPVGKRRTMEFKRGFYIYVGSAKTNLSSRIKRHLSKDKKLFWHIDYLLSSGNSRVKEVWVGGREECALAQAFCKQGFTPIDGFGSSDCRCLSHLFFTQDISLAAELLRTQDFEKMKDIPQ
jgi:Uri superfamily endonuclease